MVDAVEAASAKQGIASNLAVGVQTLDLNAEIVFTKYVKVVLPLDGFVFWVKADLLSASSIFNASTLNSVPFNTWQKIVTPAPTIAVKGSLHYSINKQQNEDETIAINQVIFTALSEVNDLDQIGPMVMFIAEIGPERIPYAFSQRAPYYAPADLRHYIGEAVNPVMRTQIIDAIEGFDRKSLVVSNSLPAWLRMNGYVPPYPGFVCPVTLFPSFAVPDNIEPPYGSVHIDPTTTVALMAQAHLGHRLQHRQLARETVKVTLYGLRNDYSQDFADFVAQYSYDHGYIGMSNMPIVRDEKRTQRELSILAIKKTMQFEINYNQQSMRDIARQLLTDIVPTYRPNLEPSVI